MNGEMGISSKLRRLTPVKCLRKDPRGAAIGASSRHKLHMRVALSRGAPSRVFIFRPVVPSVESVARAHLSTAALMPAEPHIRSPFTERLAPQSLILEVIGLGRVDPHCMAA